MEFDSLSNRVIGCALEVHRELAPGLLEGTYQRCLARELESAGIRHQIEVPLPINYKGLELECGYRIDILVEEIRVISMRSGEINNG